MAKHPNIEKNTDGTYRGWDRGKRLWQISKGTGRLSNKPYWAAYNGEKWIYTSTLSIMAETLANTNIQYEGHGFSRRAID